MVQNTLIQIRQIARAGDTLRAWRMFETAGWRNSDLPEVLSLKGRLLKDRALRTTGDERKALLDEARRAYLQSAGDRQATYPVINAATIALLAEDEATAQELARSVLAMLDSGAHEPETRYWLGATAAEAHLLLGNAQASRADLAGAMTAAPQAWEDHAATLRQFRQILRARGQDEGLFDDFSPPPSLHFSGIIHLGDTEAEARKQVARVLKDARPGAIFGALAAGVDILVAELGVDQGAQLNVVLPCGSDAFRAVSVEPFGGDWGARFDRLLALAEGVETVQTDLPLSAASIALASQVAMGLALRRAHALATTAISLRVARACDVVMTPESQWRAQGLAHEDIVLDMPAPPSGDGLAEAEPLVIVACTRPFPAQVPAAARTGQADENMHFAGFDDPVAAAAFASSILSTAPDAQIGLDLDCHAPGQPLEAIAALAMMLSRAAPPGTIYAPWPRIAALDLLAPQYRFENVGEVMTPVGDLPVARFSFT